MVPGVAQPIAGVSEGAQPADVVLGPRAAVALLVAASALAAATRMLPDEWAPAWVLRVFAASSLVAVIPGMLAVLAWRPRRSFTLLELAGFSLGVSFALVEILTVAVVTLHLSPPTAIALLAGVSAAHAGAAVRRRHQGVYVRIGRSDMALAAVIAVLALFLYAAGSPFGRAEDRYHLSIVERLAYLNAPAIDTLYFSPGIVYMYPFPGTHYMMALMARVGDIEPIFLYHKLRMFWGMAALIALYGCARASFESARIAMAVTVVAAAFVANGTFAAVGGMFWAQLAPYSHASDVAMGVLLPTLLLLAAGFLRSVEARERSFFLVAALAMAFALIVTHPREIIQFLVYLTAFTVAVALVKGPPPLWRHAAALVCATAVLLLAYRVWYEAMAVSFATHGVTVADYGLVTNNRDDIRRLLVRSSWAELFGSPLPLLKEYMPGFQLTFLGWNPVVLVVSPVALYLLRRRRLVWLLAAGILVYLMIVRFPVIAIVYMYLTYFEILYSPVRNVVFFIHLLTGVSLFLVAARLARHGYVALCAAALTVAATAIGLFRWLGPAADSHPLILLTGAMAGYAIMLFSLWRSGATEDVPDWIDRSRRRWALALALLVIPLAGATWIPTSAVIGLSWSNRNPTPESLLASLECPSRGEFCPPPADLIRFAHEQIPASGILAADLKDVYQPALFMPQQMVMWTGAMAGFANPEMLFSRYYKYLDRARAASLDQPLFNAGETHNDRVAFVRDLGVTHVLVNPRLYATMKAVFDTDDLFSPRYDDGRWALYEVNRSSFEAR